MRERPILFNGGMVRAILAGQKTQTRRVAKGVMAVHTRTGEALADIDSTGPRVRCPFGQPGDRLWVRVTWQQVHPLQIEDGRYSQRGYAGIPGPPPVNYRTIYRADGEYPSIYSLGGEPWPYRSLEPFERNGMQAFVDEPCWIPSIHMPRWACRLVLEITAVRVERLQAISARDCQAEGICSDAGGGFHVERGAHYSAHPDESFASLWTSTGGDWDSNPWVWVIEFNRINEVSNG